MKVEEIKTEEVKKEEIKVEVKKEEIKKEPNIDIVKDVVNLNTATSFDKITETRYNPVTKKVENFYGILKQPSEGSRNWEDMIKKK